MHPDLVHRAPRIVAGCAVAGGLLVLLTAPPVVSARNRAEPALPEVMTKSIAAYAALSSYSDTGTVEAEIPGTIDRAKFTTRFRRTNGDLYLDFQKTGSYYPETKITVDLSMYRSVVWMLRGQMEMYDQALKTHTLVEPGQQALALQGIVAAVNGVSTLVPSLLYPTAKMRSTFFEIEEASDAGFENVANRRCHKIIGIAVQYYPSGARTGVRPVTIWIDTETLLLRKVFEDTPKGYPANSFSRLTIAIDPQVNPTLDDAKFQFKVPSQ